MRLNGIERSEIENIFEVSITEAHQFKEIVNPEIWELMANQSKFRAVLDRISYRESNPYRPYDSAIVNKVITADFKISTAIIELLDNLTTPYLFFVDFCFVLESAEKKSQYESVYKIQLGSKASSMNRTYKIVTSSDVEKLKKEVSNKSYSDFLSSAFLNHSNLFELASSGLRPFQLLSVLIFIQKFP